MSYTNSPLVNHTRISPNKTSGRRCIDTITIHCVVGQCSVETLGNLFAQPSKRASSNYGVGYDGRIGMYVEEKDRSWCSSSSSNDSRAITIEVASDAYAPYAVTDAAYNATIRLVADICKRNGIKQLKWKNDRSLIGQVDKQNMTAHRWFANKACPGDYLYNRFGDIANKVNAILGGSATEEEYDAGTVEIVRPTLRKGSYGSYTKQLQDRLKTLGYPLGKYGADSSFGKDTLEAVKLFQKNNGLTVDGVVGPATWAKLDSDDAVKYEAKISYPLVKIGYVNDAVKVAQKALIAAGYDVGKDGADGRFGNSTKKAVVNFQAKNGLYIDGVIGPATWEKLKPYIK